MAAAAVLCAAPGGKVSGRSASQTALDAMRKARLVAVAAAVDVRTGELAASAASEPVALDLETSLLPLSIAKLWLAASWWDRVPGPEPVPVHEMLVGGSDEDGRRLALALKKAAGSGPVVSDLERYGARTNLGESTGDGAWADALSIGEANLETTLLRVSEFLRAVGNDGNSSSRAGKSVRIMKSETARRVRSAMMAAVARGTAQEIARSLKGTGWRIGGKTGTGPGPAPIGPSSDGWFAGLLFDPQGTARYTVAAYVRRGGKGGGNAARICAAMGRALASALE